MVEPANVDKAPLPSGRADHWFASLYDELHRLAAGHLRGRAASQTLGTTTLLHEAFLRMQGVADGQFSERGRFLAYASRAMRTVIIDYARSRRAVRRGGEFVLLGGESLDRVPAPSVADDEVERLAAGLEFLDSIEPELAQLVDLHSLCGFDLTEIARLRGVSDRTVQRDWRKARLLLRHLLKTG